MKSLHQKRNEKRKRESRTLIHLMKSPEKPISSPKPDIQQYGSLEFFTALQADQFDSLPQWECKASWCGFLVLLILDYSHAETLHARDVPLNVTPSSFCSCIALFLRFRRRRRNKSGFSFCFGDRDSGFPYQCLTWEFGMILRSISKRVTCKSFHLQLYVIGMRLFMFTIFIYLHIAQLRTNIYYRIEDRKSFSLRVCVKLRFTSTNQFSNCVFDA